MVDDGSAEVVDVESEGASVESEKGDTGMDGHHQLLAHIHEKVGCWNLGRKSVEAAAGQAFDANMKAWKLKPAFARQGR